MGLSLGNTNISEIYLGSTKISKVYLGSSKIYSNAVPPVSDEVQIGNQIWKTFYLDIDDGGEGIISSRDAGYTVTPYVKMYTPEAANRVVAANYPSFRVATNTDYNTLFSSLGLSNSTYPNLFSVEYGGNDTYGLHFRPWGSVIDNGDYHFIGSPESVNTGTSYGNANLYYYETGDTNIYWARYRNSTLAMFKSRINIAYAGLITCYNMIRLVKDAT